MTNDGTTSLQAYEQACENMRHYSNASLTVRIISVGQGIALLSAWAFNVARTDVFLQITLPIFGIIFTVLLFRFHKGYFRTTLVFYDIASKIEETLFEKDCRPMSAYKRHHEETYKSLASQYLTLHAPFTLIGIFCMLALIISIVTVML